MSPVRFLAKYSDEDEQRIIKCMVSTKDGVKTLYVVETNMIVTSSDPESPLDYRKIGYKITSRRNSTILESARINHNIDGTRYIIENMPNEYHTIGECLYAKLFDWCARNKVTVLGII